MQFLAKNLCIGIDPSINFRHPFFEAEERVSSFGQVVQTLTQTIMDELPNGVASFKFQSAYFEARGVAGIQALIDCVRLVNNRGHYVILDAKRGDIGTSMQAYGRFAFSEVGADSLTVTPWMGPETFSGMEADLAAGKFIYIVLLSSNGQKGSFQGDLCDSINRSEGFGHEFLQWLEKHPQKQRMGLVVGVNRADELSDKAWGRVARFPMLMPGVGAQGSVISARLAKELVTSQSRHFITISRGITGDLGKSDLSAGLSGAAVTGWSSYQGFVRAQLKSFVSDL
jgi:orotidine-5'-phosphate decarboxylase